MSELRYQLDLLKAMNQKLTEKERIYTKVCESADGAFLYCDPVENRVCALGRWKEFFDFDISETKEFALSLELVEESGLLSLQELLFLERTGEESRTTECRLKGKRAWFRFRAQVYYDREGIPTDKVIYIDNITKMRSQNEELAYMAYYDNMTGLYNRNYFVRLLGEYVKRAEDSNSIISVMTVDIDGFRKVNDSLGIVAGDELVQQFGCFIKELCGEGIIACHLHSDVYCIAIYDPAGNRSAEFLYRAIQKRVKDPFRLISGQELRITVSAGVAEYPEAGVSALELVNCAEIVGANSKELGHNTIQYFNAPVMDDLLNSIELENKLKKAVYDQDFFMYYQPQYYTGNKRLRGVEALIRWRDEDSRMISPATFIPVAEKSGTIIPIGKWVVEESVKQYAAWKAQFGFPFIMSINISALQYKREDFVESTINVLKKYRVRPAEIELEITESVLIDDFEAVSEKLNQLREYGIRISLDDFGTGFSALSYLRKLPIDTLKIDKSFIDNVITDSASRVITESIINMVKSLGYESVAEGVEDEQQYQYLHATGCDVIQGYLFSRPLPPEEVEGMLNTSL